MSKEDIISREYAEFLLRFNLETPTGYCRDDDTRTAFKLIRYLLSEIDKINQGKNDKLDAKNTGNKTTERQSEEPKADL